METKINTELKSEDDLLAIYNQIAQDHFTDACNEPQFINSSSNQPWKISIQRNGHFLLRAQEVNTIEIEAAYITQKIHNKSASFVIYDEKKM